MNKELLLQGSKIEIKEQVFLPVKELITPFINIVKPFITNEEPKIRVKYPDFSIYDENGKSLIGFTRVSLEYFLNDADPNLPAGYKKVIGLNYALDVKDPVCKIYVGYRNTEGSLVMPNDGLYEVIPIEPETPLHVTQQSVSHLLESATNIKSFDEKLEKELTTKELCDNWGKWIISISEAEIKEETYKVKISSNSISKALKSMLIDQKSEFYLAGSDTYLYNVYNVCFDEIMQKERDIVTEFEKAILIARMLNV